MDEETSGTAANVGVRKMNEEGNVVQEEGFLNSGHRKRAWFIFLTLVVLSMFGIWQIFEIIMSIV